MKGIGKADDTVVYYDFEGILSQKDILKKIERRYKELIEQGFTERQIFIIIFEDSAFKTSFINGDCYINLRNRYLKLLD